jgi:prepilin-type processing-associated H-X9-DG protein
MKKMLFLLSMICIIPANSWGLPVTVSFDPLDSIVDIGDILAVDLIADIPDPVLGWGLDVSFDPAILSLDGAPTIGSSWATAIAPDGDGLAGFAFPLPVSGNGITLATLNFEVLTLGTSPLIASVTPGDLSEGFPLAFPAPPGSFANVNFVDGSVSPVPEPATIMLLASGLAGLGVFGRRKFRNSKE